MSDRHQRALDFAVTQVKRLRPGERITLAGCVLQDIEPLHHNGYAWTPPDRVLENIVGSSYEYRYFCSGYKESATFERITHGPLRNGYRTYVSPDRRKHYYDCGGLWMPKGEHTPPKSSGS